MVKLLISKDLPLTALGFDPNRDFGFFHVWKLSVNELKILNLLPRIAVLNLFYYIFN
jgi:hypothetical protein